MEIKNKKQELSDLLGKLSKAASYDDVIVLAQNMIVLATEIKTGETLQKEFDLQLQQAEARFEEKLKQLPEQKIEAAKASVFEMKKEEEPTITPEVVTQKTFEKPIQRATTISEKLESPTDKTLAGKFRKSPISDLVKAVNINQKILFTKELFKGDSFAFNEALTKLNSFPNKEEAFNFLKSDLQSKNSWKEGSTALTELVELLERRYV
ncbi:MAG: hypothetical protein NT150_14685 [Bacteroidetes bacterium]|nr:hypothetical protein [Bacteroidota bacterium]